MIEFFDDQLQLFGLLIRHNVKFVVIGGYAVINYGYERVTSDLDIWIKKNNENRDLLVDALEGYGIHPEDLMLLRGIDFSGPVRLITFGEKPLRIEFLTEVSNVDFDEAFKEKNLVSVEGMQIPMIKYEHLILSKFNTNRLKDKADIEELQRIRKYIK